MWAGLDLDLVGEFEFCVDGVKISQSVNHTEAHMIL